MGGGGCNGREVGRVEGEDGEGRGDRWNDVGGGWRE